MKKILSNKFLLLGVLFVLFLVPLGMIKNLAWERQQRGDAVVAEIAQSTYQAQSLSGPLLVLPYRRTVRWLELVGNDEDRHTEWRTRVEESRVLVPPDLLDVQSAFRVETRARQLYEARLLHADVTATGQFTIPSRHALERPGMVGEEVTYEWLPGWLALGIGDARGIRNLVATVGAEKVAFVPGTRLNSLPSGVMAPVAARPGADVDALEYRVSLGLSGTGSLSFMPVGQRTEVRLAGDWAHPSFFGNQLPVSHSETDSAFNAVWQTSYFASGVTAESLAECEQTKDCRISGSQSFGVRLVDPVDRYLMTDRTLKYASLFLLLTFGACFLVEVLKRVRVHPVQYMLVGAAQALFFLLVLALAEHITFIAAYAVASVAIVALLTYYASAILSGWRRGAGFGGVVAILYALLYGILQSEDSALLLGAIGLLVSLAVVMAITRRIDWYRVGELAATEPASEAISP